MSKVTSIQVYEDTLDELYTYKTGRTDTYEDVIRRLMAESNQPQLAAQTEQTN